MSCIPDTKTTEEMYKLYLDGLSMAQVARCFAVTRQAVYSRFKAANKKLRSKSYLPFQMYDNQKFSLDGNGYYRLTTSRKEHVSMHRYVYQKECGEIPEGYDIHHIDGDKSNNKIGNLECISKPEHTRLYSPHHNQYKNHKTISEGKYK